MVMNSAIRFIDSGANSTLVISMLHLGALLQLQEL